MNDGTVLFLPPIKYERDIVALSVSLALSEKNEDHTHKHKQTFFLLLIIESVCDRL